MRTGWYSATTAEKDRTAFLQTLSRPYNSNSRKDRNSHINPHSGRLSLTVSNTNSSPIQQSITPRQPAPQGYQAPQPKKTNVGLIIGIVAGSVTLLIVLIVIAVIFFFSGILTPNTPPLPVPTQLYTVPAATKATDKPTEAETEQPTEKATEKPTEKQTEKPTEKTPIMSATRLSMIFHSGF
nr:hypothetical protein [uncultured Ruminococcus sp.]